jgi:hypothetical protein
VRQSRVAAKGEPEEEDDDRTTVASIKPDAIYAKPNASPTTLQRPPAAGRQGALAPLFLDEPSASAPTLCPLAQPLSVNKSRKIL